MDQPRDAASFTGETLAWFEEGEEIAARERARAAERPAGRRRYGLALVVLVALATVGFAAVLVARHLGLIELELPLELPLPWE